VNRTPLLTATAVVSALLAAACSGGGDDGSLGGTLVGVGSTTSTVPGAAPSSTSSTTSSTPTSTLPPVTATTIPDILRMPLTGEPVADAADIPDRPALVAKLGNAFEGALPQAGLNRADIVIEQIINDGVTRLAAVFHTQGSDPVGPVRSGRAQDVNLLLAFDRPLFAWSGGNATVRRMVRDSDLVDLDAVFASGYYRRSGRASPNNLFSSTEALWAQGPDDASPPSAVLPYLRDGEELTGDPATEIEIRLDATTARWVYDADDGRYYRWQDGEEHNTEDSGGVERVSTENVVVMMADYGRNFFDGNPEGQVLGSNPVYVFTGGTVRVGVWLRFDPTDPFALFDNVTDLNEIGLQPGRTWIEIPRNRDGSISWE
jgi:hypothetical protein